MSSAFRLILAFAVCLVFVCVADSQPPKGKGKGKGGNKGKTPEGQLDPWGRVEGAIIDTGARYYVWFDGEKWHLRSAARKTQSFTGTIKVKDGAIRKWIPIGLDFNRKKGTGDGFTLKSRQELVFSFQTARKSDGVDLKIEGESGQIEFDLTINGKREARSIFIGGKGQHPPEVPFRLPIAPPKPEKKPVEKKTNED